MRTPSEKEASAGRRLGPLVVLLVLAIGGLAALAVFWPIDAVEDFWRDHLVTQAARRAASRHGCDPIEARCAGYACFGPCYTRCWVECRGGASQRYKCVVSGNPLRAPWGTSATAKCIRTT